MRREAVISRCGLFRYELRRIWNEQLPMLVVCMLNPSTADAERDDQTILTLIHFARLWGFGGLLIVNLCAFRSSHPTDLLTAADRFGPNNENHLRLAMSYAAERGGRLLVGWGNDGERFANVRWFMERAQQRGIELVCLGTTDSGAPKHPMARGLHRIPRDQQPMAWKVAA